MEERRRPGFIARTAAVQSAWQITGHADYVLVVAAASVERSDALTAELMNANRNLLKFTTAVALRRSSAAWPFRPDP